MTTNDDRENRVPESPSRRPTGLEVALAGATGLALIACAFLALHAHTMSANMAVMQESTHAQLAKITDQLTQNADENNRRIESMSKSSHDSVAAVQDLARAEVRRTNAALASKIAAQTEAEKAAQKQISGELDELKEARASAGSKLDAISGDVSGVKSDLTSTQAELQATNSDLKRVTGDMGVMSGLIATNSNELAALRELGERNYVEFDLKRTGRMQKIANLQLALAKVDPKRNRFTLDVLADDKRVEKRDKTLNEPVQLYVAGYRQPVEIVVNNVKKDEVTGYVAVPKEKVTRQ